MFVTLFAGNVALLVAGQMNAADLPGRCPASQVSWSERGFDYDKFLSTLPGLKGVDRNSDEFAIEVCLTGDIRSAPLPAVMLFTQKTNYYERREALQKKLEKRISRFSDAKQKAQAYRNYAMLLLYIGEFEKLISRFGPESADKAHFAKDGTVQFALGQAYFRLGKYAESRPFAKAAYDLDPQLDSRWGLMNSELGFFGKDFYAKHSEKDYTTKHIEKAFPTRDANALPFEDVTDKMGIHRWGGTGSASFIDLDGDGWDDLISERKFFPFEIYKNVAGHFEVVPQEKMGHQNCSAVVATPGDYDNDGKPDIFRHCCNYDGPGPTYLLHNKGEMTFEDVTAKSGLSFPYGSGMVVAWADYDLDGFLDLAVGDATGTTRLYHNNGNGTFTDVTQKAGTRTPPVLGLKDAVFGTVGVSWGDLDDDGYPDLFIQGWGWKRLFMNNGNGTFRDVTKKSGLNESRALKGYTNQIFDYDNDGKLDLYVGQYVVTSDTKWGFTPTCTCSNLLRDEGYGEKEIRSASTIYRNNGDGTFTDMSTQLNFLPLGTMGANNGDWDNDGYQDIVMGAGGPYFQQAEPFLFYHNNGDGSFTNLTPFENLGLWGKGHGATFGDYDHDGNLDLFLNNGGAVIGDSWASMLLHNKGNGNHWLEVAFKAGPKTNRMAVGARVSVSAGGKNYVQELWSGSRFGAANTLRLHFGLAKADKAEKVEVRWPNREQTRTALKDVAADQAIEVSEVDGTSHQLWAAARPGSTGAAGSK